MITEIKYGELLVVFERYYSLEEFREAAQVRKGSYADELVERIYNSLFWYSRDLLHEFGKFYAIEYSNFAKFLFWRYKIKNDIAFEVEKLTSEKQFVAFCEDDTGMLADDTVKSILDGILINLGEKIDEDKNGFCDE